MGKGERFARSDKRVREKSEMEKVTIRKGQETDRRRGKEREGGSSRRRHWRDIVPPIAIYIHPL